MMDVVYARNVAKHEYEEILNILKKEKDFTAKEMIINRLYELYEMGYEEAQKDFEDGWDKGYECAREEYGDD